MISPAPVVQRVWTLLLRAHARSIGHVQGALKSAGLPALEWYDVLLELERGGPLRPRDLQARLLLAQYNLSRLLDRLVAAGLIERRPCPDDKRGHLVAATADGLALRERMWPVYAQGIQDAVGACLTLDESEALVQLLAPLAGRSRGTS